MDQESQRPAQRKTLAEIRQKAYRFCSLQERSPYEVKQKLFAWGLYASEAEQIIIDLIEDNFLNEARFAQTYVGGKFRILKWGKAKITQGLKKHRVSPRNIQDALRDQISDEAYKATLQELVQDKLTERMGNSQAENTVGNLELKAAIWLYIYSKGYHQSDFEHAWEAVWSNKNN